MIDCPEYTELLEEFPELTESGVIFEKEILAHFGLLFSKYAVLEAGVQNCYTMWQLELALSKDEIKSQAEWVERFDALEGEAFAATFGTLLRLVSDFDDLKPYADTLTRLKKGRDYFAHHFFREENSKMFSSESMLHLLSRMHILRDEVNAAAKIVDTIYFLKLQKLYPNHDMKTKILADSKRLKDEYLNNPPENFGWETD